jgi:2,3,4,5-tetrahydropyridine-2,6-dicarboxylate N-succinyltransferase
LTISADLSKLQQNVEELFNEKPSTYTESHWQLFSEFKQLLNDGALRAAEPDSTQQSGWRVNAWVKKGILLGFRIGGIVDFSGSSPFQFFDKSTYPLKTLAADAGIRIVPGGSSIRDGVFVGRGVTCMPPMYINVGAYVGDGTMVDSHALVGSCAQIGRNCHISAASQIGGVLEPVGALPVIVEDDVLIGGNCGVYEGTVIKRRSVLGSGTILNRSTPVYDLVRGVVHRANGNEPLVIPEDAVVVPGSRPVSSGHGKEWGIALYTPVIVKYRDAGTETKIQLEDLLR